MGAKRIRFLDSGFRALINDRAINAMCHAEARRRASELESREGVEYRVQYKGIGRPSYLVRPADYTRMPALTHEQWMDELWPKVGGPIWRPH